MDTHKSQDLPESHISDAKDLKEISSTCNSSLSIIRHHRPENDGPPTSSSISNQHSSHSPYIINVKTEQDIDMKQEEDI